MREGSIKPSFGVIGRILSQRFASRIAQNQNFFGNLASAKTERAILLRDYHLRYTKPFLSCRQGGAARTLVS